MPSREKNNLCFIINLETDSKNCLEHRFFSSFSNAKFKEQLKQETNFKNIKCFSIGCDKRIKNLTKNCPLISEITKALSKTKQPKQLYISNLKILFIIDQDFLRTNKDSKEIERRFYDYKQQICTFIKSKDKLRIDFKFLKLPLNETFEFVVSSILNYNRLPLIRPSDPSYLMSVNSFDLIWELYKDKAKLKNKNISPKKLKKILTSDEEILETINSYILKQNENTTLLFELKQNLFKDNEYLKYRKSIKNDDFDTYHYLFDWWL